MNRRIWLCADDYGLSPGVNRAIRDLIARGRLNATSVMVVGPAIGRDEVASLKDVVAERHAKGNRCEIGLHVTLTAPFRPLTMHFKPVDGGLFLPLPKMLQRGFVRRLDREIIQSEIATQFSVFRDLFGRTPGSARVDKTGRSSSGSIRPRRCSWMRSAANSASVPRAPNSDSTPPLPAPMIICARPISAA